MSTVAAEGAAWSGWSGYSKSQIRRMKRKHTLACLWTGLKQQRTALMAATLYDELTVDTDANVLLQSIAVHRADNAALNAQVHYAATANLHSWNSGCKSKANFKVHRKLHQHANAVKHNGEAYIAATPPSAPVFSEATRPDGVTCCSCGLWNTVPTDCNVFPSFQPFSGTRWNIMANEFIPNASEDVPTTYDEPIVDMHEETSPQLVMQLPEQVPAPLWQTVVLSEATPQSMVMQMPTQVPAPLWQTTVVSEASGIIDVTGISSGSGMLQLLPLLRVTTTTATAWVSLAEAGQLAAVSSLVNAAVNPFLSEVAPPPPGHRIEGPHVRERRSLCSFCSGSGCTFCGKSVVASAVQSQSESQECTQQ